eukprot:8268681-Pyramimonas_sp.AAC.1
MIDNGICIRIDRHGPPMFSSLCCDSISTSFSAPLPTLSDAFSNCVFFCPSPRFPTLFLYRQGPAVPALPPVVRGSSLLVRMPRLLRL